MTLQRGCKGPDVQSLQIKLAGFRGTIWDGNFGPGTELQVMQFQKDFMRILPTGIVDTATAAAINDFAKKYTFDFNQLKCPCGQCSGFGQGLYKDQYQEGKPHLEIYCRYEYPGIHKVVLWTTRAACFYTGNPLMVNSGYRCSIEEAKHARTSGNHHGKAIDMDAPLKPGELKKDDMAHCDAIRAKLVEVANCQIGWAGTNKKSLEPSDIAPTWVHLDVRQFDKVYLDDSFFVRTLADLDA